MGGGSMVRAVGRAVGPAGAGLGGVREAVSTAAGAAGGAAGRGNPPRVVLAYASAPSSSSPSRAALLTGRGGRQRPHPRFCDGFGGESTREEEEDDDDAERFVLGPAPSRAEVMEAVSAIQQVLFPLTLPLDAQDQFSSIMGKYCRDKAIVTDSMQKLPSPESKSDWIESARQLYCGNSLQNRANDKIVNAFRLLRTNPLIQRMVISLSSDKAVWDAVMQNEAVKELRESICAAEHGRGPSTDEGHDIPARLLKWIIENTKVKIMEYLNKITKIVNELFSLSEKNKVDHMDLFEDALRSSVMLCMMVFIVVVISRIQQAWQ